MVSLTETLAVLHPVAFTILSHRARGESAREVGWRLDNFVEASRLLLPLMLVVSALLVGLGLYWGTLDFGRWEGGQTIMGVPGLSLIWGPLQQYALQGFINRRARRKRARTVKITNREVTHQRQE